MRADSEMIYNIKKLWRLYGDKISIMKILMIAISIIFVFAAFGIVYEAVPPLLFGAVVVAHAVFSYCIYQNNYWQSIKGISVSRFIMLFSVNGVIALMGVAFVQHGNMGVIFLVVVVYCFVFMWFFTDKKGIKNE